jgi:hypothetical protein
VRILAGLAIGSIGEDAPIDPIDPIDLSSIDRNQINQ